MSVCICASVDWIYAVSISAWAFSTAEILLFNDTHAHHSQNKNTQKANQVAGLVK